MSQQQQVKIGAEFFAKIKLDYANWKYAFAREFLQNSFDAPGTKTVRVTVEMRGNDTVVTVENDGLSMTRDVLENKLLTLGGSGKNFEGENTGGFGVAKSLLYYTHKSYKIHTGSLFVSGSGAQYTITEAASYPGTKSTVVMDGDQREIVNQFRKFATLAQWKGMLFINGELVECNLHKGARRRDLGWGVVYTNNSHSNLCVVRLNGQPMFTAYTRFKGCVIVELTGKSKDVLTSNRDGLTGQYASDLSDLLTAIAVDKRSALREQRAEYRRYLGEKLRNEAKKPKAAEDGIASIVDMESLAALVGTPQGSERSGGGSTIVETAPETGGIRLVVTTAEDEKDRTISLGTEFIIKNTTGRKTPAKYIPGEKFAAKELVQVWTALTLKLYQLLDRSGEFSVGFVFDDENEAESEQTSLYGQVYYINPLKNGKARFENVWADRHTIISLAAHEVVHGAYGLGEHDEDYAGTLTEVLAVVTKNLDELSELCWTGQDPRKDKGDDLQEKYLAAIFQLEQLERQVESLKKK